MAKMGGRNERPNGPFSEVKINHANSALTCLENYQVSTPPDYTCSTANLIDPDADASLASSFAYQKAQVKSAISAALGPPYIPVASYTQLDSYLKAHMGVIPISSPPMRLLTTGSLRLRQRRAT